MNGMIKKTEFNTIKTIKLINKDNLLKRVYSNQEGDFIYVNLIAKAKKNVLTKKNVKTLKDIYQSIILTSQTHREVYDKLKIKDSKPRRYGKIQINKEIAEQGGEVSGLQSTMLELADLKAITSTLLSRGTSDRFNGTNKFDEETQRKIKAIIRDVKVKLNPIIKNN